MSAWPLPHVAVLGIVSGLTLVSDVILPGTAAAQGLFRATPSFSMTQLHDSNLFSSPAAPEADLVTRVSPGIESEYRSTRLVLSGRYLLDIERFADHPALTTMDARQQAGFAVGYRPAPRFSWAAGAELVKTRTPGELNALTGLTLTRAPAQRASAHASVTRQLNPVTTGTIAYTVIEDRLAGRVEGHTRALTAGATHRRSLRETVRIDYRFHEFVFGVPGEAATSASTSHAVTVGWTRFISRRVNVSFDGGPRVTNAAMAAELSGSVHYQPARGDLSLSYTRTQATAIGIAGTIDIQSVTSSAMWTLGRSLQVRVGPGLFRSALGGLQADVYVVGVDVARPIARGLSIDVAVDATRQRGNLYAGLATETIARRGVLVRLIAVPRARVH